MANKCGICGADINLMQTQKLARFGAHLYVAGGRGPCRV